MTFAAGYCVNIFKRKAISCRNDSLKLSANALKLQKQANRYESDISKALRAQQKDAKASFNSQMTEANLYQYVLSKQGETFADLFKNGVIDKKYAESSAGQSVYNLFIQAVQGARQNLQFKLTECLARYEAEADLAKEEMVEPLKEEAEDMEIQAGNLKAQAEAADAAAKSAEQMRDNSIKNIWS